jgi:hypothetical protein
MQITHPPAHSGAPSDYEIYQQPDPTITESSGPTGGELPRGLEITAFRHEPNLVN